MKIIIIWVLMVYLGTTPLFAEKVKELSPAPNFTAIDVYGNTFDLGMLKGPKILLTLYRNVGCAICNLRFHELEEETKFFKSKNLTLIAIYESSSENTIKYLDGQTVYPIMIPDPELKIYDLYDIEYSIFKLIKGLSNGALDKKEKGNKLFHQDIEKDGSITRISADFLIDENGIIQRVYYGKYLGDHLPIEEIKKFIN